MPAATSAAPPETTAAVTVTLLPRGWVFEARAGETILQAAERAGIALPNSCRNGTCRTCICRLAGPQGTGWVRYLVAWPGLSVDEKREGYLLPCVAVPETSVFVDQPVASRRPAGPAHD